MRLQLLTRQIRVRGWGGGGVKGQFRASIRGHFGGVVIYRQIIDQASYLKMENTEIET